MAIQTCEAVAPCVLWIDEIEKGVPRSSGFIGDNGVSMRVMGTFLTWLQEKTSPIFVFATANQIDLLPPEMLRKGRFDEIFFVDLPRNDERREIVDIHIRGSGRDPGKFDIDRLVALSGPEQFGEGIAMTGAEIAGWINDALIRAFDRGGGAVEMPDFEEALRTLVPLAQVRSEEIAAMRHWAETHALNASRAPNAIQRRAADMRLGGRELDLGPGAAG
jgi:SpoVK/Ycf46/Vps4 family AAA+-type ATPase